MSGIRTNAAAVMLGVSPNTLRSWERRYTFPSPQRSAGGHRQYALAEIEALRHALAETQNVSSAIAMARERGSGPSSPRLLATALRAFDEDAANRLLEESLALRSLERTVEEVLLAGVATVAADDPAGAEYDFAWRLATGWLSAMKRLSPPAGRPQGVLMFDCSRPGELDALAAQALELMLRRSGLRTLTLGPATDLSRLGRALRALEPSGLVLTGQSTSLDGIGRVVYAARRVMPEISVFDYRGAVPDTGASTVARLGDSPLAARDALLDQLPAPVSAAGRSAAPARAAVAVASY